jgi:transcription-repair coupling factor (superfamily II helicase)
MARKRRPIVSVAPIRALLLRLGPRVEDTEPLLVERGAEIDSEELVAKLVHSGYRREYQVEHRGELAVRGGIIDVFPSTADEAVRIDLWGDEVERLTIFDVSDQRSTTDIDKVEIFGCRELVLTDDVRERARSLAKESPFARDVFEKIADGLVFDGMESWLPWLTDEERLFTDLLSTQARVVLVEPRRLRDRAADLVEEETSLAEALASTWVTAPAGGTSPAAVSSVMETAAGTSTGADHSVARLHLPFERLLAQTGAHLASLVPSAENTETTAISARPWPPVLGDSVGLAKRLGELARSDHRVVICADGRGSADRIADVLSSEGLDLKVLTEPAAAAGQLRRPGVHVVVAPLDRGTLLPDSKLAILAEPDITGRHRPHRVARPRARAVGSFFDDLEPGSFVVHHVHGVARYGGLVKRAIGDSERDYMLLEYRGGDRLYVPSDQIDAITPYTGGDNPTLNRLNGSEWQKQKARVRTAVRKIARELVQLYRRRATEPGHAFAPDTPWQAELEQSFPFPETPDQLKAVADIKDDMEGTGRHRWTAWYAGTSVSARRRWRSGLSSKPCRMVSKPPSSCRRHCWLSSTSRPSPSGMPLIRCGWRCCLVS